MTEADAASWLPQCFIASEVNSQLLDWSFRRFNYKLILPFLLFYIFTFLIYNIYKGMVINQFGEMFFTYIVGRAVLFLFFVFIRLHGWLAGRVSSVRG